MGIYSVSGSFALTGATEKTCIRINTPSSRKATLRRIILTDSYAGSTDEGIMAKVYRGGTDGTGTSATPLPRGSASACVSTAKTNYTAEPTSPTEVDRYVAPSGGGLDLRFDGDEGIEAVHSSALAVALLAPDSRGSNIVGLTLFFEE